MNPLIPTLKIIIQDGEKVAKRLEHFFLCKKFKIYLRNLFTETYSVIQHTEMIKFYSENHRLVTLIQKAYRRHLNVQNPPSKFRNLRLEGHIPHHIVENIAVNVE